MIIYLSSVFSIWMGLISTCGLTLQYRVVKTELWIYSLQLVAWMNEPNTEALHNFNTNPPKPNI